ncbi:NADP-binding protein [Dacryopinax primogenitus]|uniref:NADP-binding protein n=1 Tax=Dacryopinax primogenitus (strain DJM 731) TaxID=1858805 RepID=M5FVV7_DACPD|nr:NADP-binding protein [Dacryopinax primogenitus]EJT99744.1 NADP-binding protein [Dacryopinax primogenitus]
MVSVQAPATVLVTGANGFLGLYIVKQLLEGGYTVRGTVRSVSKGEWIKNKFSAYGSHIDYTIVEDITKTGAFNEAVKGVDAVVHAASPVSDNLDGTYEEIYVPAVKGAESIFNSLRSSPTVKRVVMTSSFVAMMEPHEPGFTYDETVWNNNATKLVKENPQGLPGAMYYLAAKTDAERTAWNFYNAHKPDLNWDLVTLAPPCIFNPILQDEPNFSTSLAYRNAFLEKAENLADGHAGFWIDVRDAATAHVLSLQKPKAGGERIFITGGAFKWQDLREELIKRDVPGVLAERIPGDDKYDIPDLTKCANILGMKYRSLGDSVLGSISSYQRSQEKK